MYDFDDDGNEDDFMIFWGGKGGMNGRDTDLQTSKRFYLNEYMQKFEKKTRGIMARIDLLIKVVFIEM